MNIAQRESIFGYPEGSTCGYAAFINLYCAASEKIYVTSSSSIPHLAVINCPAGAILKYDARGHAIDIVDCLNIGAAPSSRNYYLLFNTTMSWGRVSGVQENYTLKKLNIDHNQRKGYFNIGYNALPTNSVLPFYERPGKNVYEQYLPPWRNEHLTILINLPDGIYYSMYNVVEILFLVRCREREQEKNLKMKKICSSQYSQYKPLRYPLKIKTKG